MMDDFESIIQGKVLRVVDVTVKLGTVNFRLVSNVPDFPAQQYFSAKSQSIYTNTETDFELWCISLSACTLDREFILSHIDHTYRSKSFAAGYYVTDHFGAPIYLVTRGRTYYVFGEEFERVVWPYFVKHFLMLHSLEQESLHLKAAALSINSLGTLFLGRGGAGKTVFLTQLCLHGAQFISNSHSIIKNGCVYGVASSIRIRPGPWYENLTNTVKTTQAITPGELIIDPYDAFNFIVDKAPKAPTIRNICILDFNSTGEHIVKPVSVQEAYDYAEQFSLGINVYRMEEDLLDLYSGNFGQFSEVYNRMKTQLCCLIKQSRCYYISSNMLITKYRDDILALLTKG